MVPRLRVPLIVRFLVAASPPHTRRRCRHVALLNDTRDSTHIERLARKQRSRRVSFRLIPDGRGAALGLAGCPRPLSLAADAPKMSGTARPGRTTRQVARLAASSWRPPVGRESDAWPKAPAELESTARPLRSARHPEQRGASPPKACLIDEAPVEVTQRTKIKKTTQVAVRARRVQVAAVPV